MSELLLHPLQNTVVQPSQQRVELGAESGDGALLVAPVVELKGHAPDLLALLAAQVLEKLGKAGEQVRLGEQHVDRDAQPQLVVKFAQATADRLGVGVAVCLAQFGQVGKADRHQHPVQRLARARALEQFEETQPGCGIHHLVAVLRGVAAGRVDQHGLVGEPPVAVAGAAHAANRRAASLATRGIGQREAQPAIDERRRLAGAGRPDEHVPGKLVEVAAEPPGQAGALQLAQRVSQALTQQGQLLGRGRLVRIGRGDGHTLDQRAVTLGRAHLAQ